MNCGSVSDCAAKVGRSLCMYSTLPDALTRPSSTKAARRGREQACRARSQSGGVALESPAEPKTASGTLPSVAARQAAFPTDKPAEQREPLELEVKGTVPAWLRGSIIRNGPGFFAPEMQHLFDGYGMLVKFAFAGGRVSYMQRFVDSVAFREYERTGKMQFTEFGTSVPLLKGLTNTFKGLLNLGQGFTDNASVNTYPLQDGKSLVAMTETVQGTFEVDMDSLTTRQRFEYQPGDGISGILTTAHPVMDTDGTIYNLVVDLGKARSVMKLSPGSQKRQKLADVPMDNPFKPSWIHDLPATENYIIVPDTPVVYDTKSMVSGSADYVIFNWEPVKQPTKFHVIPKSGGGITTVEAPFDFMAFHYANAFESADGRELYIDTATFSDPEIVDSLKLDNLRGLLKGIDESPFQRITVPLDGRPPSIRPLVPLDEYTYFELPRINPNYKWKEHRYVYAVTAKLPTSYGNALSKMDVGAGSSKQWHEPGCIPTEPLMIPRPGATEEDDGVVTSLVSGADGKAFLLVLDAATFEEVARVQVPFGVAYGFHNQFYPAR